MNNTMLDILKTIENMNLEDLNRLNIWIQFNIDKRTEEDSNG